MEKKTKKKKKPSESLISVALTCIRVPYELVILAHVAMIGGSNSAGKRSLNTGVEMDSWLFKELGKKEK